MHVHILNIESMKPIKQKCWKSWGRRPQPPNWRQWLGQNNREITKNSTIEISVWIHFYARPSTTFEPVDYYYLQIYIYLSILSSNRLVLVSNLQTPTAHLSYKCAVRIWRFETSTCLLWLVRIVGKQNNRWIITRQSLTLHYSEQNIDRSGFRRCGFCCWKILQAYILQILKQTVYTFT